ncbi:MAG TPA: type VI immunity family protein [Polyangiaceae bacterium]
MLHTGQPLSRLGPAGAAALRTYLEAIPKDALKSCEMGDDTGPLTSRRIARDIKRLEKPAKNDDFFALIYSSSEDRPPADYGVQFLLDEFEEDEDTLVTLMRFDFPWDSAEGEKTTTFIRTVAAIASKVPFSTGTVGFAFSHWASDHVAVDQVLSLLPRYLGFEHSSEEPRDNLRDLAAGPAWITLLDATLMRDLGGPTACHALAPDATIDGTGKGYMIRAAKLPPVGDINSGAPDIGALPALARWLAPRRALFRRLRGSAVELDAASWVGRFDALDSGPWDNR